MVYFLLSSNFKSHHYSDEDYKDIFYLKNQNTIILEPKINIRRIQKEVNVKNNFKLKKSIPKLIKKYKNIKI